MSGSSQTRNADIRQHRGRVGRATDPIRVDVPEGLSVEEARHVLAAVARSVSVMARSGGTVAFDVKPASRKGARRFRLVAPRSPHDDFEPAEMSPAAAQSALKRAYEKGAVAAAAVLAGPDMLSSDQMAARLGISREAVHQKRRRGELLGLEGAKRGVRFPDWQIGVDGSPLSALPNLHAGLGSPWAVFRFLTQRHPELDMCTGLMAVSNPKWASAALLLANSVGNYGPAGG
jgi:hypothetical protein